MRKPSERPTVSPAQAKPAQPEPTRERLIPAVEAVRKVIGRSPHVSTVHRWAIRGVSCDGQRIFLEAFRIGGRLLCSLEAVHRFCDATATRQHIEPPTAPRSDAQRKKAIAKASARLDAAGI